MCAKLCHTSEKIRFVLRIQCSKRQAYQGQAFFKGFKNQGDKVRLLEEKSLDLKKAIQMCFMTEIASQQIKTIVGAGNKKTEDISDTTNAHLAPIQNYNLGKR